MSDPTLNKSAWKSCLKFTFKVMSDLTLNLKQLRIGNLFKVTTDPTLNFKP